MNEYDVIIIGGGPGGYTAAVRASKLGLKTALIERELVGGTCVNWGCIPTKVLLKYAKLMHKDLEQGVHIDLDSASAKFDVAHDKSLKIAKERSSRIEDLFKNSNIELFAGNARLISSSEVELQPSGEKLRGKNIIIATGSKPRLIPGVEYDGVNIMTTREALQLSKVPSSAVIVGSGATGMEFSCVWNSFGSKVTVLEMMPNILGTDDKEVSTAVQTHFKKAGVQIKTDARVEQIVKTDAGVEVTFSIGENRETLTVEKVLISAGIIPCSSHLGLEELGIEIERGYIKVDDKMRTNIPGIYAVGDITGKLALAFAASGQGVIAVETIAGNETEKLVYENIPRCVYTEIEVATVGLNAKQAVERGYDVVTVKNPIVPYAKVVTFPENTGFIKLVADSKNQKVLGAYMIGSDVTDHIAGTARMISLGSTVSEIINVLHDGR